MPLLFARPFWSQRFPDDWKCDGKPNPYAHEPHIPLANLESYYVAAVQNMEKSLAAAQLVGHDALYIANNIQHHLKTLTICKKPRKPNHTN